MPVPFTGTCECATLRFRCRAQPLSMYNCHCKGFQTIARATYMPLLVMQSNMVDIDGQLHEVPSRVEKDHHGQRSCCARCGNVLFSSSTMPNILLINAHWLAEKERYVPVADIWTVDANPAHIMDTRIPKVWKSPPLIGQEFV
jgi:hypothetical protein